MPVRLLSGKIPNPPTIYLREQFNQIVRKIEQALSKEVSTKEDHEDQEAMDYFFK